MTAILAARVMTDQHAEDRTSQLARGAEQAIRRAGYALLHEVKASPAGRRVRLSGRVPTVHLRRIAEEAAAVVAGEERVDSRIVIG